MTPVVVHVENASESDEAPGPSTMHCWVSAVLSQLPKADRRKGVEINVRIVDAQESADLNERYRHQPKPTNVLSFPAELPEFLASPLLGDLAICASVVQREAQEQGKVLEAHWAHMVIHGTLHLLGYDHQEDQEALEMESLETEILGSLNFPPPYQTDTDITNTANYHL